MKQMRVFILSMILCQQIFSVHQDKDQLLFSHGNECFLRGQFSEARNSYEKIETKSLSVWQNMGNCFFNEKNYACALLCWKRAEFGANWFQLGILFSSEQKAKNMLHLVSDAWWKTKLKRFIFCVSKKIVLNSLFCVLLFLLFFLYRCWNWSSKFGFAKCNCKIIWILIFGIITLSFMWWQQKQMFCLGRSIAMQSNVIVYAGPDITFHQKFKILQGEELYIINTDTKMYKVVYNNKIGWVERCAIEII